MPQPQAAQPLTSQAQASSNVSIPLSGSSGAPLPRTPRGEPGRAAPRMFARAEQSPREPLRGPSGGRPTVTVTQPTSREREPHPGARLCTALSRRPGQPRPSVPALLGPAAAPAPAERLRQRGRHRPAVGEQAVLQTHWVWTAAAAEGPGPREPAPRRARGPRPGSRGLCRRFSARLQPCDRKPAWPRARKALFTKPRPRPGRSRPPAPLSPPCLSAINTRQSKALERLPRQTACSQGPGRGPGGPRPGGPRPEHPRAPRGQTEPREDTRTSLPTWARAGGSPAVPATRLGQRGCCKGTGPEKSFPDSQPPRGPPAPTAPAPRRLRAGPALPRDRPTAQTPRTRGPRPPPPGAATCPPGLHPPSHPPQVPSVFPTQHAAWRGANGEPGPL